MVYFQTQNTNLGKFWRVLQWKLLVYFMAIWSILWPFGLFYGHFGLFCGYLVYFSPFWYVAPRKSWQSWTLQSPSEKLRSHMKDFFSSGLQTRSSVIESKRT
jgi:hypothetical protein